MCQNGPRVAAVFPDAPSRFTSSARMLYKVFQDEWMAGHLAARAFRLYGLFPDAPEVCGNQYGSFALQFAARAQALLQMLVIYVVVACGVP